jgi:hypothetical protein
MCVSAALARAASPLARVHVLGKQPALVNQQVRIEVEICAAVSGYPDPRGDRHDARRDRAELRRTDRRPDVRGHPQDLRLHGPAVRRLHTAAAGRVFEKPGTYKLPAIDIDWFDANTNRQEKAEAPAVTIVVTPRRHGEGIAPEAEAALAAGEKSTDFWRHVAWGKWIGVALVLVVLAVAASWLASRLPGWKRAWRQRQEAKAASDPAHFEAVVAACRKNDPEATYAALTTWSRRHVGSGASAWSARMGDDDLARSLGALEARLFAGASPAGSMPWQSDALLSALQRARTKWLASRKSRDPEHRALPKLNPGDEHA